jgi:hypothetical protein
MHEQHCVYLRCLKVALPAWGVFAVLHGLSLYIPLNADAPGDNMADALRDSMERLGDELTELIRRGSLPNWPRLLEFAAMIGAEGLILLGAIVSLLTFRWHWIVPVSLGGV